MSITINLKPTFDLTDDTFMEICHYNKEINFEKTAKGDLIIMSPTGSETGYKNSSLLGQLWNWNYQKKLGKTFDSSTGFKLPNGATRSPDVSWIKKERWETLTKDEKRKFAPICPDFVIELLSVNDDWDEGKSKMQEYLENGIKLGWLIDSEKKKVAIYRADQEIEILDQPQSLLGENILPEFVLDLTDIFE